MPNGGWRQALRKSLWRLVLKSLKIILRLVLRLRRPLRGGVDANAQGVGLALGHWRPLGSARAACRAG